MHGMVGEQAQRLVCIALAEAARTELGGHHVHSTILADKDAARPPIDDVHMGVDLQQPWRQLSGLARLKAGQTEVEQGALATISQRIANDDQVRRVSSERFLASSESPRAK